MWQTDMIKATGDPGPILDSGQVRDLTVSHHEFKEVLHHKKSWAFDTVFIRKDLFWLREHQSLTAGKA